MNVNKVLTHWESLGYWLNEANLLGSGVEVGAAFGLFSSRIASVWKGKQLFMVDPWTNLPTTEYFEGHAEVDYEQWYRDCQGLAAADSRITLIRKRSAEAAPDFTVNSLDWVYIDANHDYAHVMQDLDLWYPKVKVGGLVGGHDFYLCTTPPHFCEVEAAVLRWTKEHNVVFSVTPCTSWWFIK